MSEQNLSYISRGASLLVVLGVLVSGALAYAQSSVEGDISVSTNVASPEMSGEFVEVDDDVDLSTFDVSLADVALARSRFVKKTKGKTKASGYGILFTVITGSDAPSAIPVDYHIRCSFVKGGEKSIMRSQFKQPSGGSYNQQIFYEMKKQEWEIAKKKQPFSCMVVLNADRDETNNAVRIDLAWKKGKLEPVGFERY